MEKVRPLPEQLLNQMKGKPKTQGKLKIFFGACAGAGKTYDMLSAAREKLSENVNVVAGVIETHGRVETGKLLEGIPKLPMVAVEYQGITVHEFDLDGALKLKPSIILIDELAHSNISGSRHPKRWQDIQELLTAGIDVYTTLNVQHLESLNDTIANLTGIRVKETIPDLIFDSADEIVLVDIPSEVILQRLREGKVYLGEFAKQRAAHHFFRIENLIALRELALRRTAERVDALRDIYQKLQGGPPSSLADKILVCINHKPISSKLIRKTKQQASRLKCGWTAIYVENEDHYYLTEAEKAYIEKTLRLAESLGGKTQVLQEPNTLNAITNYSRTHHFTRIIIGNTPKTFWKRKFSHSLVNDILNTKDLPDIFVLKDDTSHPSPKARKHYIYPSWHGYLNTLLVVALCTLIGVPVKEWLGPENIVMIYLVGLVIISSIEDRSAALFAALLSVICYNLFFTHPYYRFGYTFYYIQDYVTLVVFIIVGLVITTLTSQLRQQSLSARQREKYTSELYEFSRKLLITQGKNKIAKVIAHHIGEIFNSAASVWLPDNGGILELASHPGIKAELKEESVAQWSYGHNQRAGLGTNTMPSARGFYLPLSSGDRVLGVLGVIPQNPDRTFTSEENMMLEALALQAALALERK